MNTRTLTWKRIPILFFLLALLLVGCSRPAFLDAKLPDDGPEIEPTQASAMRFVEKVTVAGQSGVQSGQTSLTITEGEVTSFLSISAQLAQVMQAVEGVDGMQDLSQLQDLDLQGLDLEGLDLEGLGGSEALDNEALRRWQELAGKREGLGGLRLPDLSLRLAIKEPQVYFKADGQDNGQIIVRGYGQVRQVRQPLRVVVAPRAREGELVLDFVEGKLGPVDLPEGLFDIIGKGLAKVILAGQNWAEINEITVREGTLTLRGRYSKEQISSDLCFTC